MRNNFDPKEYLVRQMQDTKLLLSPMHQVDYPFGWRILIDDIVRAAHGLNISISFNYLVKNSYNHLYVETEIDEDHIEHDELIDYLNFLKEVKKIELKSFSICTVCGGQPRLVPRTELMLNDGICKLCREGKDGKEEKDKNKKTGTWLDNF